VTRLCARIRQLRINAGVSTREAEPTAGIDLSGFESLRGVKRRTP
jgi:hypothetical protein